MTPYVFFLGVNFSFNAVWRLSKRQSCLQGVNLGDSRCSSLFFSNPSLSCLLCWRSNQCSWLRLHHALIGSCIIVSSAMFSFSSHSSINITCSANAEEWFPLFPVSLISLSLLWFHCIQSHTVCTDGLHLWKRDLWYIDSPSLCIKTSSGSMKSMFRLEGEMWLPSCLYIIQRVQCWKQQLVSEWDSLVFCWLYTVNRIWPQTQIFFCIKTIKSVFLWQLSTFTSHILITGMHKKLIVLL